HGRLAGAKLEDLLELRNSVSHRAGARERPEIPVRLLEFSPMEAQLRKLFSGETHVRIALVVAIEDVVARLVGFYEIVLEEQCLAFVARRRRLDASDLRHHYLDSWFVIALLEVARDALLQVARLADIDGLARSVNHAVHAGQIRQRSDQLARVEGGRGDLVFRFRLSHGR